MKAILIILFFPLFAQAQIVYLGSASNPVDGGTGTASPAVVIPPGGTAVGDLVIVYCYARNASATFAVSATGGQTWNAEAALQSAQGVLSGQLFWCRFNGTWSTNPSWTFSSTTSTSAVMHVFRPTNTAKDWAIDPSTATFPNQLRQFVANTTSAMYSTQGSFTTSNASTVSLYFTNTDDDNTWSVTLNGWTGTAGGTQYRNIAGNDVSSTYSYIIQTSAGTPGNVTQTEATLGADGGIVGTFTWYEFTPVSNPRRRYRIN